MTTGLAAASARCDACERPRGKKRSLLAIVFVCAHCSVSAIAVVATVALASVPTLFGVGLQWILRPFFIGGLLAFLMWPTKPLDHTHASTTNPQARSPP